MTKEKWFARVGVIGLKMNNDKNTVAKVKGKLIMQERSESYKKNQAKYPLIIVRHIAVSHIELVVCYCVLWEVR